MILPRGLYMDVHIPVVVTAGLRQRGIDVLTSQEDGTREFDDEGLLRRACVANRLLVTQDDDFLRIAAEWQSAAQPFAGIIFAHQLGPSIGRLIYDLELLCTYAESSELENLVTYLPLPA